MKAFIVHRMSMRAEAKQFLASLAKSDDIFIEPVVLKKSAGSQWKKLAKNKLLSAEIVIIFDNGACAESENTMWEINLARRVEKSIVSLSRDDISNRNVIELQSFYDFSSEFEECFVEPPNGKDQLFELYKIMVTSSDQLVQRRQVMNGFFITVIGALIGAYGLVAAQGLLSESTLFVLYLFTLSAY